MTRIGVLTGGGDVPGLNPCIRTLVYAAADRGYEVVGLRRGWAGLLDYNLDDDKPQDHCVQPLTKRDVRTIDRTGGTFLHTSRNIYGYCFFAIHSSLTFTGGAFIGYRTSLAITSRAGCNGLHLA